MKIFCISKIWSFQFEWCKRLNKTVDNWIGSNWTVQLRFFVTVRKFWWWKITFCSPKTNVENSTVEILISSLLPFDLMFIYLKDGSVVWVLSNVYRRVQSKEWKNQWMKVYFPVNFVQSEKMRNPTRIKTIPRNIFVQKRIKISAKSSLFFKLSGLDSGPSRPGVRRLGDSA